jgi:hypothetical protein
MMNFSGVFRWIPTDDNGPTMPFDRAKMSAFAYVEPRAVEQGAVLLDGLPEPAAEGLVEGRWIDGYPCPDTRVGDTVTVIAAQRPIATVAVTAVSHEH